MLDARTKLDILCTVTKCIDAPLTYQTNQTLLIFKSPLQIRHFENSRLISCFTTYLCIYQKNAVLDVIGPDNDVLCDHNDHLAQTVQRLIQKDDCLKFTTPARDTIVKVVHNSKTSNFMNTSVWL